MIGSARMYEWTASLTAAWNDLLAWVGRRAGLGLELLESRSIGLDEIWSRPDMGCVFMCGYPWALQRERPALLAAPVPSPPRYGDRPVYVSDFIVRADSASRILEDTFGGRIAYSTEHSHSGYNAARHHLLRYRSPGRAALYGAVLGPYLRQRLVIDAVLAGEAEVAAVDGFGLDLLRHHDPALAGRLRVVATTAPAPSPPLVASPAVDADSRARLTAALLEAHRAPELRATLERLLLRRFEAVDAAAFDLFLAWQDEAAQAGYRLIA